MVGSTVISDLKLKKRLSGNFSNFPGRERREVGLEGLPTRGSDRVILCNNNSVLKTVSKSLLTQKKLNQNRHVRL